MLAVQTFGKFQVTDGNRLLDDETLHSPMLLKLMMYLILYRDKNLTTEEIADAIWQEEEIENPAGALKNLMYRLRKVLNSAFGEKDFILTNRGSYRWNPEEKINIDTDAFERLITRARAEHAQEKAITDYEHAMLLYQGDFMSQLTDMYWIVPLNSYYHSLYLTVVKSLAELYASSEHYDLVEKLCSEALRYDSGDEQLYDFLIRAQMNCGKISIALDTYENAREILEKEFGVRSATLLDRRYEELMTMNKGQSEYSISEVQRDITEDELDGVFLCRYPVFKEIYHYEARKSTRLNLEAALVLLTLYTQSGESAESSERHVKRSMNSLEEIISESLRVGDVAARYSDAQFILLLPSCSRELAMHVSNRLVSKLHKTNNNSYSVNVRINIEKVAASNQMVD